MQLKIVYLVAYGCGIGLCLIYRYSSCKSNNPTKLTDLTAESKCHGIAIGDTNVVLIGQTPIETVTSTKWNPMNGLKKRSK